MYTDKTQCLFDWSTLQTKEDIEETRAFLAEMMTRLAEDHEAYPLDTNQKNKRPRSLSDNFYCADSTISFTAQIFQQNINCLMKKKKETLQYRRELARETLNESPNASCNIMAKGRKNKKAAIKLQTKQQQVKDKKAEEEKEKKRKYDKKYRLRDKLQAKEKEINGLKENLKEAQNKADKADNEAYKNSSFRAKKQAESAKQKVQNLKELLESQTQEAEDLSKQIEEAVREAPDRAASGHKNKTDDKNKNKNTTTSQTEEKKKGDDKNKNKNTTTSQTEDKKKGENRPLEKPKPSNEKNRRIEEFFQKKPRSQSSGKTTPEQRNKISKKGGSSQKSGSAKLNASSPEMFDSSQESSHSTKRQSKNKSKNKLPALQESASLNASSPQMFNSSQESSHSTKRHQVSSQGENSRQSKNESPALQDAPDFLKALNSSPGPSNKNTNKSSKNRYKEEQNRESKGSDNQGFKIPKILTQKDTAKITQNTQQKDTAVTIHKNRTPLENVKRQNVRLSYKSVNEKKPCDIKKLGEDIIANSKVVALEATKKQLEECKKKNENSKGDKNNEKKETH